MNRSNKCICNYTLYSKYTKKCTTMNSWWANYSVLLLNSLQLKWKIYAVKMWRITKQLIRMGHSIHSDLSGGQYNSLHRTNSSEPVGTVCAQLTNVGHSRIVSNRQLWAHSISAIKHMWWFVFFCINIEIRVSNIVLLIYFYWF